jgi:hypothetical protein
LLSESYEVIRTWRGTTSEFERVRASELCGSE